MYRTLETDRKLSITSIQKSLYVTSHSSSSSSPVVILEHVLRPVAVVNVPVQDEDSQMCIMGYFLRVACGERCRVEEAETAGRIPLCVMTRRTNNRNAITHLETEKTIQVT